MGQKYSEDRPAFSDGIDAVIVAVEGLLVDPPDKYIAPERLAMALRDAGIKVTLHSLGTPDPTELVGKIAELDESTGARALSVLADLELAWAIRSEISPKSGMRELIAHLVAVGVDVVFVSCLDEQVARQVVASSLRTTMTRPIFGRIAAGSTIRILDHAHDRAGQSLSESRTLTLIHSSFAENLSAETTENRLVVGKPKFEGLPGGTVDAVDLAAQCQLTDGERMTIEKEIGVRDRLIELRSGGSMTNEEMAEMANLTGGVRFVSNTDHLGYVDAKTGQQNAAMLRHRRRSAAEGQYLLEVISSDAALIEVELRNWLIVHRSAEFKPLDRITFGQTVDLAERSGFPAHLVERLRAFNKMRNDAIHNMARGIASYHQMTDDYMADCVLLLDVEDHVLESAPLIGRVAGPSY